MTWNCSALEPDGEYPASHVGGCKLLCTLLMLTQATEPYWEAEINVRAAKPNEGMLPYRTSPVR
jgi:hypothetical protein